MAAPRRWIPTSAMTDFETDRRHALAQVAAFFDTLLQLPDGPESRLIEPCATPCCRGKGFRPYLLYAAAQLFNVDEGAIRVAAAVEAVHCYSLIHDDLPAMDDDDMRRGKASLHVAFDEATAILAGDALLTLAFEILADEATHQEMSKRLELVTALARAAGMQGMVGGQMIDLQSPQLDLDAGGLTRLQKMKTGALIGFALEAGAILGGADEAQRHALTGYAHDVGLAFQIADDVLDVDAKSVNLGKTAGKDAADGKVTFASLLGTERARDQAGLLVEQAINHLALFGDDANGLRQAAEFVIKRHS